MNRRLQLLAELSASDWCINQSVLRFAEKWKKNASLILPLYRLPSEFNVWKVALPFQLYFCFNSFRNLSRGSPHSSSARGGLSAEINFASESFPLADHFSPESYSPIRATEIAVSRAPWNPTLPFVTPLSEPLPSNEKSAHVINVYCSGARARGNEGKDSNCFSEDSFLPRSPSFHVLNLQLERSGGRVSGTSRIKAI